MQDFSLHILDICENAIDAGASRINIYVTEDTGKDKLTIEIEDNGKGMEEEFRRQVLDPFVTTRTTRRVGLGLPLMAQAAKMCDGDISVDSAPEKGTRVKAGFRLSHIDIKPMGDMATSLVTLIAGHPEIDFIYRHKADDREFLLDTVEIKSELDGVPLNHPEVLIFLKNMIREGLEELKNNR